MTGKRARSRGRSGAPLREMVADGLTRRAELESGEDDQRERRGARHPDDDTAQAAAQPGPLAGPGHVLVAESEPSPPGAPGGVRRAARHGHPAAAAEVPVGPVAGAAPGAGCATSVVRFLAGPLDLRAGRGRSARQHGGNRRRLGRMRCRIGDRDQQGSGSVPVLVGDGGARLCIVLCSAVLAGTGGLMSGGSGGSGGLSGPGRFRGYGTTGSSGRRPAVGVRGPGARYGDGGAVRPCSAPAGAPEGASPGAATPPGSPASAGSAEASAEAAAVRLPGSSGAPRAAVAEGAAGDCGRTAFRAVPGPGNVPGPARRRGFRWSSTGCPFGCGHLDRAGHMGGAGGRHQALQPVLVGGAGVGQGQGDMQMRPTVTGDGAERSGVPVGGAALGDLRVHPEGEPDRFLKAPPSAPDPVQMRGGSHRRTQHRLAVFAAGRSAPSVSAPTQSPSQRVKSAGASDGVKYASRQSSTLWIGARTSSSPATNRWASSSSEKTAGSIMPSGADAAEAVDRSPLSRPR